LTYSAWALPQARSLWSGGYSQLWVHPIETVAKAAPNALRIAELYVRGDDAFLHDYVARVVACGCAAFRLCAALCGRSTAYLPSP